MRALIGTFLFIGLGVVQTGCSREQVDQNQVTLASGVNMVSLSKCIEGAPMMTPRIEKSPAGFRVTTAALSLCEGNVEPFLTSFREGHSTLVLSPRKREGFGFRDSCECARVATVEIERGKIESGQTLYLLSGYEVIGDVRVP